MFRKAPVPEMQETKPKTPPSSGDSLDTKSLKSERLSVESLITHIENFEFEKAKSTVVGLFKGGMTRKQLLAKLETQDHPVATKLIESIEKARTAGITGGWATYLVPGAKTADSRAAELEPILREMAQKPRIPELLGNITKLRNSTENFGEYQFNRLIKLAKEKRLELEAEKRQGEDQVQALSTAINYKPVNRGSR
jgi:hypothetical protein